MVLSTLFSFVPLKFLALEFCCVHACWSQVIIFSFYWRSPRDASQVCWIFVFASVCLTLVERIRIDDKEDEAEAAKEEESFALFSCYALFIDQQKWTEHCSCFSIAFIRLREANKCTQMTRSFSFSRQRHHGWWNMFRCSSRYRWSSFLVDLHPFQAALSAQTINLTLWRCC